ncbi:hypothetical protein BSP38_170 [Bacillus phage BSP38]|uniref:Uncharacterized protein n=1 Tax=Bacillus phage BSP38 TaxID=2283013 RepID=A0A345MK30_BPBSP|nr:hypothetical protein HWB82_gp148 [Bacillus phage BSP38]AXH71212.1 hypothetical protein BSP38_170 [Bacillus phage BSP38]
MDLVKLMQDRKEKIEEQEEILDELVYGLEGAEVSYKGKSAVINDVDWGAEEVELNYDDENYEWVSFAEGAGSDE